MSVLHQDLLRALREAGDEGLDESEIMALGGMWWRNRLDEIRQWRLAVISLDRGRYYLESERGVERAVSSDPSLASPLISTPCSRAAEGRETDLGAGFIPRASADGSLSSEPLVLFPSGSSHYELDEAA